MDYFVGSGQVNAPGMVSITQGEHKGKFFKAKNIMIATGCKMRRIPGLDFDGVKVMTSREALASKELPKSIIIVGAGAIGVEFAYFYNAFGSKVHAGRDASPDPAPWRTRRSRRRSFRSFEKQGITLHVGTKCENFRVGKTSVKVDLVAGDTKTTVEADVVLSAIGVVANLEGVLAPALKPELEKGYLKVGDDYQTSIPGIFGAGDIIGPPWLAHVATYESVHAVSAMFGHGKSKRVKNFPGCTYCQPQVASTGLTEKAAREKGLDIKIGKFPFTASGKAVASAETEGFVKVVTDAKTGEIYGAHIIGSEATELIAEYGLAMELEASVEEIHQTIHAHPTLSEAVMEAAAASLGEAIHI